MNFQWTQGKGATQSAQSVEPRTAVSTDSTNLGIRGTFDVQEVLQVVCQCETSAAVNSLSVSGNSRVGLSGFAWGTVFYGSSGTPYKAMAYGTKADDPFFATDVYGFASILSSPGLNYKGGGWATASNTATIGFDVRSNSTVAYFSPKWAGVSFKVLYAADTWKDTSGPQDPVLDSGVVNYDQGPLSVNASYERHDDGLGLVGINTATVLALGATVANTAGSDTNANRTTDSAFRLGARYQFDRSPGLTTVSGMFEELWYEQSDAVAGSVKLSQHPAWQLAPMHSMGNHELRARFSMANEGSCTLAGGATCSTSGYNPAGLALVPERAVHV